MTPGRIRLTNVARKALFQRARLRRSADSAKNNFAPGALQDRAKTKVNRKIDATLDQGEQLLRTYAVPLGIAAVAGLAFAFRRPLAALADQLAEQFMPASDPSLDSAPEPDDEPV